MRVLLIIALLASRLITSAQSENPNRVHRHEVGVDATSMIGYYVAHAGVGEPFYLPSSPYMFTYRYHLRKFNIRFGAGGAASDIEREATWYGSQPGETYHDKRSELALRLGIEHAQELTKRWQVYYGIDFRPDWEVSNNGWTFSNAGYRHARRSSAQTLAGAAVLGIRFRITPRFSLLTEGSFAYAATVHEVRDVTTPQAEQYPPIPPDESKTRSSGTSFTAPFLIVAAFDL